MACNLSCPFCFSKSSVSSLEADKANWDQLDVGRYYEFAREQGATRLVITGGGEPLLKPQDVVSLVRRGKNYFDEIACFTNGSRLTSELSKQLYDAGLSYFCWSRHHHDDARCRALMGKQAPNLEDFVAAAGSIPIRATCVTTKGWIDSNELVEDYMVSFLKYGITQFTFKHTYIAYEESLFAQSEADRWSLKHQVEMDPFVGRGEVLARLPWGPEIRRIAVGKSTAQVCYYFEPTPKWELENQLCRSTNLLSDGTVFASLEDQRSQLFQLKRS